MLDVRFRDVESSLDYRCKAPEALRVQIGVELRRVHLDGQIFEIEGNRGILGAHFCDIMKSFVCKRFGKPLHEMRRIF